MSCKAALVALVTTPMQPGRAGIGALVLGAEQPSASPRPELFKASWAAPTPSGKKVAHIDLERACGLVQAHRGTAR